MLSLWFNIIVECTCEIYKSFNLYTLSKIANCTEKNKNRRDNETTAALIIIRYFIWSTIYMNDVSIAGINKYACNLLRRSWVYNSMASFILFFEYFIAKCLIKLIFCVCLFLSQSTFSIFFSVHMMWCFQWQTKNRFTKCFHIDSNTLENNCEIWSDNQTFCQFCENNFDAFFICSGQKTVLFCSSLFFHFFSCAIIFCLNRKKSYIHKMLKISILYSWVKWITF